MTAAGRAPSRPGFNLNLVGGQNELVFDGGSLVMDFAGQVASRYPQFQDGLFLVELDADAAAAPVVSGVVEAWPDEVESVYRAVLLRVVEVVNLLPTRSF